MMTNDSSGLVPKVAPSAIYKEGAGSSSFMDRWGEDALFHPRLFRSLEMPMSALRHLGFSVAMDKINDQTGLESAGFHKFPYVAVVEGDDIDEKIAAIGYSLFILLLTKPSNTK